MYVEVADVHEFIPASRVIQVKPGCKWRDNRRAAIVCRRAAGVTLSRLGGAPRRYGLTTSVKCPGKAKAEEILFLLPPRHRTELAAAQGWG